MKSGVLRWVFNGGWWRLNSEVPPAVIIANGSPLEPAVVRALDPSWPLVCADGGANRLAKLRRQSDCAEHELVPRLIVGDLDSVTPATLRSFPSSEVLRISNQNDTDLSKSLRECSLRWPASQLIVLSGIGGSLQHMLANFSYLSRFSDHSPVCWPLKSQVLFLRPRFEHILEQCPIDRTLGVFAVGRSPDHVTTSGLAWDLTDQSLAFGEEISSSNRFVSSTVTVRADNPVMLVIDGPTRGEKGREQKS